MELLDLLQSLVGGSRNVSFWHVPVSLGRVREVDGAGLDVQVAGLGFGVEVAHVRIAG